MTSTGRKPEYRASPYFSSNPARKRAIFSRPRIGLRAVRALPSLSPNRAARGCSARVISVMSPEASAMRNRSSIRRCSGNGTRGAGSAAASARRAREACWRAVATAHPAISAISVNGTSKPSWSTNASRCSAGSSCSTRNAAIRMSSLVTTMFCGSCESSSVTTGSGSHGPTYCSRRTAADRRRSRQIRLTTVVSQAPSSRTGDFSAASRNHASCTASSASSSRPVSR